MEPKPDPIHRRERDHADGIEAAHGSGRIKPPAMLADLSFQDHRDRVVTQLAKHNSDSSGQPPEMPSWARDKWNLRALGSLPVEPVQTRAPVMALYGFGFKNEDLSESRAFYNFLESQPVTPDRLYEALKFYPAQEEVLGIAAGLLQRSPTDRALGLSLMKELCRSDLDPASPIVISQTGGLIRWLLERIPDAERHTVTDLLPEMFREASPSFLKMIEQAVHRNLRDFEERFSSFFVGDNEGLQGRDCILAERRLWRDLIDGLSQADTEKTYSILLGVGISTGLSQDEQNYCLDAIVARPLTGVPALARFVARLRNEPDTARRAESAKLLGAIDDFAGSYWGSLVPWAYEQPLRMLESRGVDPVIAWKSSCPSMSPGTFLFAYSLADGRGEVLQSFEQLYTTARQAEGEQWLRAELKKSLIRSVFLEPITKEAFLAEYLPRLALNEVKGCLGVITILGFLSTRQRREFPQLVMQQLKWSAGESSGVQAHIESWIREQYAQDSDRTRANAFVRIRPELPLSEQLGVVVAEGLFPWLQDESWYAQVLGSSAQHVVEPFPPTNLAYNAVAQFIRAQTIEDNKLTADLLRDLGESLSLCDAADQARWESYRHNEEDPRIARQLRALSPLGRARWRKDVMAFIEPQAGDRLKGIGNQPPRLLFALFTSWPEFMFKIGKFPVITAACTAFDSGAYYSKGLVSYVNDAHIKAALLFDMERLAHFVAPQLPEESRHHLLRGEINQNDVYRYAGLFQHACISRTIVKLVEDEHKRPFLLVQPSFMRDSLYKEQPNLSTVQFLAAVADRVGAGLASAIFNPDPIGDQEPLFMPGRLPARALTIPPSKSPGGQIENWDNAAWVASHRGAVEVMGLELLPPNTGP